MKLEVDIETMKSLSRDIELEIEHYKEIIKKFYDIVDSFSSTSTWVGTASTNYARYLNGKKKNYEEIYNNMVTFNQALKSNILELELALKEAKVNVND